MTEKKIARIDLWLPPRMKMMLELLADKDRRKVSEYCRVVLEEHIESLADERQESE